VAFRASELFRMVGQSDSLLDEAWTHRRWATFVQLWLAASVGMTLLPAIMVFAVLLIPGLLYNAFAALIHTRMLSISVADLWHLAAGLGGIIGLFTLLFTMPVMLFRQLCGDLGKRDAQSISTAGGEPLP
jgi:hypothetical protein